MQVTEKLMTIERWQDAAVKAAIYSRFENAFNLRGTVRLDGRADIHTTEQEIRLYR